MIGGHDRNRTFQYGFGAARCENLGFPSGFFGSPAGRPIFLKSPRVLLWGPAVVKIGVLAKNIPISRIFMIVRPILEQS